MAASGTGTRCKLRHQRRLGMKKLMLHLEMAYLALRSASVVATSASGFWCVVVSAIAGIRNPRG